MRNLRAGAPETKPATAGAPAPRPGAAAAWRGARLVVIVYIFIGALQFLKVGAGGLAAFNDGGILIGNPGSTLGVGWLGAMLTLSGSTMTTAALTLRATGVVSEVQGFTMVTGARLGAAFVVLLVAVLYALRARRGGRKKTVSTAVLTLAITGVIYVPGAVIGLFILRSEWFHNIRLSAPAELGNLIDLLYGWLTNSIESWPPLLLFFGGIALLIASFKLIDGLVPQVDEGSLEGSRLGWLRRKWPMFFLGVVCVIATMSVSVALTILVPLVAKGYVKRDSLVPYIIGADLGTLVDKLLIAFVVGIGAAHPASPVRVILAELIGTTAVGLLIMSLLYTPVRRAVWKFQRMVTATKPRLAVFTACLFATPLTIIAVSTLVG